jgi:hypothetical protein
LITFIIIRFFRKTFWNSKYLYFLNLFVCFVKKRAKIKGGGEVIGIGKIFGGCGGAVLMN